MAQAQLIFDETTIQSNTTLYQLYLSYLSGMMTASEVEVPSYTDNVPMNADGTVDENSIKSQMKAYSDILMKNSAYTMANILSGALSGSGGGSGSGSGTDTGITTGYVSKGGDSMLGALNALYGLTAGISGNKIIEVGNVSNTNFLKLLGDLKMSGSVYISDVLQCTYSTADSLLTIYPKTNIAGGVTVGNVEITGEGIKMGDFSYYHSGNANLSTVDWAANNMTAAGSITAGGVSHLNNSVELGVDGTKLLYSVKSASGTYFRSDVDIYMGDSAALRWNSLNVISFSKPDDTRKILSINAPGMTMTLGSAPDQSITSKILLGTEIDDYSGTYRMISREGDGNFPNSLTAGAGNSNQTVLKTYISGADNDTGVVFPHKIRLGDFNGPSLDVAITNKIPDLYVLRMMIPYYRSGTNENIFSYFSYIATDSAFRDLSKSWSATLNLNTDAEFVRVAVPLESSGFSILGENSKTRLTSNSLFLNEGAFIEGKKDGIRYAGNSYFDANLSSQVFSSGFLGSGWGISVDSVYGGYRATFDNITIRKKLRVYELEVQKDSVVNGSMWVSSSCAGDNVEEVA